MTLLSVKSIVDKDDGRSVITFPNTHKCRKCGEIKKPSEFGKNTKSKTKLDYHCKACVKEENINQWRKPVSEEKKAFWASLEGTLKRCKKCGEDKDRGFFRLEKRSKDGLFTYCRDCENKYQKERRSTEDVKKKHQEYRKAWCEKTRNYQYKRFYGISLNDYNRMFDLQEGKCLCCGTHQSVIPRRLRVDHNHKTGRVRGLLCDSCNVSLGLIKENIGTLESMILYLKGDNNG